MADGEMNLAQSVKEWTVRDYYTPKIKAEVILDMLLSEEISELLRLVHKKEEIDLKEVTFLAKEFPVTSYIDGVQCEGSVDYLAYAGNEKKIFLVELKTTNGSFSWNQFKKYLWFCGKKVYRKQPAEKGFFISSEKLLAAFKDKYKPSYMDKVIENGSRKAVELKSTEKYIFQLAEICHALNLDGKFKAIFEPAAEADYENNIQSIMKKIEETFDGHEIYVVYISLTDIFFNKDKTISKAMEKITGADEDKKRIRDNIYNIVLAPVEAGGKGTAHIINGYDSLNKNMQEIIDKIMGYEIKAYGLQK